MTRRVASVLVALATPLVLASCGASTPDVAAPQAQPVATESWPCPKDVMLLESLQTAYEHIEGRPAANVEELRSSGLLPDEVGVAATIADGAVVGTESGPCEMHVYADLDLDPRCAAELDRMNVDIFTGLLVSQYLGVPPGGVEQARAVGVDHGPYVLYSWDEYTFIAEPIDPSCPDEDAVGAAMDEAASESEEYPCMTARKTLETATEAYVAQSGGLPPDQRTLVDKGFLREAYDDYDLAPDGSVVVVTGSECEQFEQEESSSGAASDASAASDCDAARMTLEVAAEAYFAQTGGPPVDEQTLVDAGFLRDQMTEFDLLPDGSVTAVPGGRCV